MTEWRPDVLGPGFQCCDIDLGSDAEGPLVATLVRALPEPLGWWRRLRGESRRLEDVDVIYVHGWSDYFFQRRLARFWTERGARFFALDLRKYGRSLGDWQTPGYIEDLHEYDAEIERALEIVRREPSDSGPPPAERRLVLMGHSTGGLVLSLWSERNPGVSQALVLNSPWLEFQLSGRIRQLVAPLVDLRARLRPHEAAPQFDFGFYTRAQLTAADPDDPIEVNPAWRPERSHAVTTGWLRAILAGHARISNGIDVREPVCVLLSKRSETPLRWNDDMARADTVLEVDEVARSALRLGPSVTIERIDGALHDVFLSYPEVRDEAYARLERWTTGWRAGLDRR